MALKLQKISCLYLLFSCYFCHLPLTETATEYNRYLAHLFQKYGNGGTMTFEGLEHLMYSLGLGHLEFEPSHTIEQHYPEGNEAKHHTENEQQLKSYFEQETVKLLPNEADDVQLATHGLLERVSGQQAQQAQQQQQNRKNVLNAAKSNINGISAADNADVLTNDRIIKDKGILLEFKELHDPKHRHPRDNDATFAGPPLSENVCLTPKSLLNLVVDHDDLHKRKLYRTSLDVSSAFIEDSHDFEEEYNDFINNMQLTPIAFMKLCPALLAQIDQHVCVKAAPLLNEEQSNDALFNAWIYASASIFILSACGLLGILLVPLMKTVAYQEILKFLVAVAVGTLSGDALMHLLPHALVTEHHGADSKELTKPTAAAESHGHDNTAVWICACAFLTAVFMYILENLLPLLKGDNAEHGHGHSHGGGSGHSHHTHHHSQNPAQTAAAVAPTESGSSDAREINVMLNEFKKDKKTPNRPLTPVAFMVIIGDGLHNLTDGLAIGAAFATDPVTGLATAFAVLCHELPHELGDFALLLQTGVSIRRAICLNIVSSVLSFVGMAVGLLIAGLHSNMTQWIYAGTAGSFLYIAFADLIPAMGEQQGDGLKSKKRDLKNTLIQILGIIVGGIIMLLIAVKEEDLEQLFK